MPFAAPTAQAAGLGQIKILSALGQPLRAEIALNATQEELSSLSVKLASPDAFRQAHIEYSSALIGVRFSIESRADGTPYVNVTSTRAINDTFIDLLVELDWAQGQLVREYTALIDPPDYTPPVPESAMAEQPQSSQPTTTPLEQPAPVAPVAPVAETPAPASGQEAAATTTTAAATTAAAVGATSVTEVPTAAAADASAVQATTPTTEVPAADASTASATTPAAPPMEETPATKPDYTVKSGDTLYKIAKANAPEGVTVEQVLIALFQANPDAFSGKNMNRLKAGKILHQPTYDQITAIAPDDANKEIHVQATNWNAYRKKIAEAAAVTPAQESQSAAGGKIATVEQASTAQGASKGVVKLSKGDGKTPEARAQALQEEVTARQKALDDANMRVAALEKQVNDLKHLLEIKGQLPAPAAPTKPGAVPAPAATASGAAKPQPATTPASTAPVVTPPANVANASAPAPATPKKPKVVVAPPPPAPSLLEKLLSPLYLGALVVILALVGGYLWYRRRAASGGAPLKKKVSKSRTDEDAEESDGDGLKLMNRTVTMPAVAAAAAPASAAASEDDVDPIAEADLYLNFGRDTQAEEILKEALKNNPKHEAAQIKLLQIYANRKDKGAFEKAARTYHDQAGVNSTNWMAVAAMGYALDASNPLYEAGANVDASGLALGAASQDSAMDLDFDLLSSETAPASDVLDIGGDSAASPAPAFDIGEMSSGITDITGGDSAPDHTLNVSSADFAALSMPSPGASSSGGGNSMDFSPVTPAAPAAAGETHDRGPLIPDFKIDFSDLSSDLGGMTLAGPVAGISGSAGGASAPPSDDGNSISFSDIGLSIDVPSDGTMTDIPGTSEIKDAHWFDVQTKFDLAKAYQEMGDKDGAREILQEVIKEGDGAQKSEAQQLLDTLS